METYYFNICIGWSTSSYEAGNVLIRVMYNKTVTTIIKVDFHSTTKMVFQPFVVNQTKCYWINLLNTTQSVSLRYFRTYLETRVSNMLYHTSLVKVEIMIIFPLFLLWHWKVCSVETLEINEDTIIIERQGKSKHI